MRLHWFRFLLTARAALLLSLAIMWANYGLTARWAHVPGSIHGSKEWLFVPLLLLTTILAIVPWPATRVPLGGIARVIGWAGLVLLASLFVVWFPPSTWTEMPFLDNWPARYLSTLEGIALLKRGAIAGWQWHYLGGYHLSSDVTQSHTLLAFLPVTLFGPPLGFHLLHAALFLALPALVFRDLRFEDPDTRWLATGLTAVLSCGFSYFLLRSGDTNSLAGLVCLGIALTASHEAARGARWGGPALVAALALVNYVHAGFVVYAALFLVLEALFYRDRGRLKRALIAAACGFVAGLPVHWESWRYPAYFIPNNVIFDRGAPFEWLPLIRKVYYNVELLWLPGRWFNDFGGLSSVCLPITAYVAWQGRTRAAFYSWLALTTLAALRFNTPEFAYLFLRPIHVLVLAMGPVLATFIVRYVRSRRLAVSFIALVTVYLQILVFQVPHIRTPRDADPALMAHIASLEGALVLLENTPHRDMDADPAGSTQPPPFQAHIEQAVARATGRRLYAGLWDGWQWSPYRDQLLAGGAFKGRALSRVPLDDVTTEMRRWGIRHLVVWSEAAKAYFRRAPAVFVERWASGEWTHFEYLAADTRDVATSVGSGTLESFDPLGARVRLMSVQSGAQVVVRTNYHPSWSAAIAEDAVAVPLFSQEGQMAFIAPKDGSYDVEFTYPRRPWTWLVALLAVLGGSFWVRLVLPSEAGSSG
jgi:hypothetical protein